MKIRPTQAPSICIQTYRRHERSADRFRLQSVIAQTLQGNPNKAQGDIGDRVKAGQVVAEVEAPELDQQILQANAAIEQAKSSVQQAEAAIQQGRANENLARLTAGRMSNLLGRGVISKQDNDNAQAQYAAQQA